MHGQSGAEQFGVDDVAEVKRPLLDPVFLLPPVAGGTVDDAFQSGVGHGSDVAVFGVWHLEHEAGGVFGVGGGWFSHANHYSTRARYVRGRSGTSTPR